MSIFDPKSISYQFYRELFSQLSINEMLVGSGHCKLIKDMSSSDYVEYCKFLQMGVTDVQKPEPE